ncbi:MAG: 50S ribosomal protein L29 [Candidatus Brocadiae bacterium]|nr:50S ribosomal protein L29 [Candidatus Brocadiia bacterium]
MKISEFRQKATDELRTQVKKIHEEHFNLRFRRVTDVIENPGQLRELRRDLARIHTVIRERELADARKAAAAPKTEPKTEPKAKGGAGKPEKAAKPG